MEKERSCVSCLAYFANCGGQDSRNGINGSMGVYNCTNCFSAHSSSSSSSWAGLVGYLKKTYNNRFDLEFSFKARCLAVDPLDGCCCWRFCLGGRKGGLGCRQVAIVAWRLVICRSVCTTIHSLLNIRAGRLIKYSLGCK